MVRQVAIAALAVMVSSPTKAEIEVVVSWERSEQGFSEGMIMNDSDQVVIFRQRPFCNDRPTVHVERAMLPAPVYCPPPPEYRRPATDQHKRVITKTSGYSTHRPRKLRTYAVKHAHKAPSKPAVVKVVDDRRMYGEFAKLLKGQNTLLKNVVENQNRHADTHRDLEVNLDEKIRTSIESSLRSVLADKLAEPDTPAVPLVKDRFWWGILYGCLFVFLIVLIIAFVWPRPFRHI